jgi:tetratricopeptide (TPR) repeat protein
MGLTLALCLASAPWLQAQQKPASSTPAQNNSNPSNPFPEDTKDVPVMPSTATALDAAQGNAGDVPPVAVNLPANDVDPVRSPDEPATSDDAESAHSFSSSRSGLESILPDPNAPPDRKQQGRRNRHEAEAAPDHQETAEEDLTVGKYYLDNKNWKAAQSRFQSAMVLSPESPEVYWGLAESARHLGDVTSARANYLKVIEYDPDSRHAKEAAKVLKTPEMAEKTAKAK